MENTGYAAKNHGCNVKRYCRTMDLRNNPELIAEYKLRHSKEKIWPEILEGIRSVGILEMEIYILGTRLFMIVETPFRQWKNWQYCQDSRSGKIICLYSSALNREVHHPRSGSLWKGCFTCIDFLYLSINSLT